MFTLSGGYYSNIYFGFIDLNRDSDKMIFQRLLKEFEAARAAQSRGSFTDELRKMWHLYMLIKLCN